MGVATRRLAKFPSCSPKEGTHSLFFPSHGHTVVYPAFVPPLGSKFVSSCTGVTLQLGNGYDELKQLMHL